MKKIFFLVPLLTGLPIFFAFSQKVEIKRLKCEYLENPAGVESQVPGLSWQLISSGRNISQTAYRILVSDDERLLNRGIGNIWDSNKIYSDKSIQVSYSGKPLRSAGSYYWKVMVWDNRGNVSGWSKASKWQMGLLSDAEWKGARWIAYDELPSSQQIIPAVHFRGNAVLGKANSILPLLRKEWIISKPLKKATVFISGLGHFSLSLNGKKVGDHFLDPGWTKYDKSALYVTFDITGLLEQGRNAMAVMLGNGFYFIPRDGRYRKITGAFGYPKMIARLVVEYKDGTSQDIVSDNTWKTAPGPVTYSSIYGGEDYNATLEQKGWDQAGFDDHGWKNALIVSGPPGLNSQTATPVRIFDTLTVKKVTQPKPGIWVYDMGQNASAIPAITLEGRKNSVVRLIPGELLNRDGTVNQSASGGPHYYDYTLKGEGIESWQPQFTYYGFRYIQVEGAVPGEEPNTENIPAVMQLLSLHMRNAAERTGQFSSSSELFNKTNELIDWAIQSNMMSVLTDCPHREKLGWLEEAHLMGASVRYNYDLAALGRKIVHDMITSQTTEGLIPDIAPEYVEFSAGFRDSPEWGSNGIIFPWYLYRWYGDKHILEESYPMMQKYADYLAKRADNNILAYGLGDWFDIGPRRPGEAQLTPKGLTATAIYYYDLSILAEVAKLLQKQNDVKKYHDMAGNVKAAFNREYFNKETKQYSTGSQTANAMAVYMKLTEPEDKDAVVENIVKEIRDRNNRLSAGDIGYRYLLRVLEEEGRSDVIFDMNSRSDVPGYGWQLASGATALTESWQAYGFVSNNHFMLGHLMEWFYSGLAGVRPAEGSVAFKEIIIRPEPTGNVTSARAAYDSPYGLIAADWKKNGEKFSLVVEVPVNTTATIYLPANKDQQILENNRPLNVKAEMKFGGNDNGRAIIRLGSGKYNFAVK